VLLILLAATMYSNSCHRMMKQNNETGLFITEKQRLALPAT
jgi:hypothetical protein